MSSATLFPIFSCVIRLHPLGARQSMIVSGF
jgi:hypothetical protein